MRQKRRADSNVGLAAESGRRSGAVIETGCRRELIFELFGPGACLEHDGKVVEALTSEPRPEANSAATSSEPLHCVSRSKITYGEVASDA